MPKRIPIRAAREIAAKYDCRQVVLLAWDGERTHVVTYGSTVDDCCQAAEGGNRVKLALGWPESLCDGGPPSVKRLLARIEELESALHSYREYERERGSSQ